MNPGGAGGRKPSHSGGRWRAVTRRDNGHFSETAGQRREGPLTAGAPSRIRTCAHGSGECATLTLSPLPTPLISKFWSAVGA